MTQTRTASATGTDTYTVVDIERVVRRVKADLIMIGDSTGGWTPETASNYAHDVEVLAKAGYLKHVDITLLSHGVEVKATRFEVDTEAGGLTCSRPGGVLWPKVRWTFSADRPALYRRIYGGREDGHQEPIEDQLVADRRGHQPQHP